MNVYVGKKKVGSYGLAMKDIGPCLVCHKDASLMYGIWLDKEPDKPLAICSTCIMTNKGIKRV